MPNAEFQKLRDAATAAEEEKRKAEAKLERLRADLATLAVEKMYWKTKAEAAKAAMEQEGNPSH